MTRFENFKEILLKITTTITTYRWPNTQNDKL